MDTCEDAPTGDKPARYFLKYLEELSIYAINAFLEENTVNDKANLILINDGLPDTILFYDLEKRFTQTEIEEMLKNLNKKTILEKFLEWLKS